MRAILLSLFSLSVLLYSCGSDQLFEGHENLREHKWPVTYVPEFTFQVNDTLTPYDVKVSLRYSNLYQYQNIYLTYIMEGPEGEPLDSTLTNLQLFDAKTGYPTGSGLGDIFEHQFTVLPEHQFPVSGEYRIRLRQTMRPDTLMEVLSVGVNVLPAGTEEQD